MYCLHKSGKVLKFTQFQEKIAIHFATLGGIYIGQFNEACTQLDEKAVVDLLQ